MGAALVRVGAHGPQHTYFEGDSGWIYGRQLREGRLAVQLWGAGLGGRPRLHLVYSNLLILLSVYISIGYKNIPVNLGGAPKAKIQISGTYESAY